MKERFIKNIRIIVYSLLINYLLFPYIDVEGICADRASPSETTLESVALFHR